MKRKRLAVVMDAEAAGPSNRGSRRRPQAEKRKMEECEGREGEAAGERNVVREVQGGRKRQRMSEIIGAGSWICRESYCGLSLPDQSSLERHYRGHCAQEEEKLVRLRVKRRREEGEEEQGGLRERRRLVLDRLSERRELRRETRLRHQVEESIEYFLTTTEVEECDLTLKHLGNLELVSDKGGWEVEKLDTLFKVC